jgi:hypothetical protein
VDKIQTIAPSKDVKTMSKDINDIKSIDEMFSQQTNQVDPTGSGHAINPAVGGIFMSFLTIVGIFCTGTGSKSILFDSSILFPIKIFGSFTSNLGGCLITGIFVGKSVMSIGGNVVLVSCLNM